MVKRSRKPALSAVEGDLHLFPSAEVDLLFAKRPQAYTPLTSLTPTPVILSAAVFGHRANQERFAWSSGVESLP